jgi:hypothetical protein
VLTSHECSDSWVLGIEDSRNRYPPGDTCGDETSHGAKGRGESPSQGGGPEAIFFLWYWGLNSVDSRYFNT